MQLFCVFKIAVKFAIFFIAFAILKEGKVIKELQINEQIREKEVRVIDSDGSQLGIMSTKEALKIAESKKLDLVNVSPNAEPPVCRIMNYGKFKYAQAKKEKASKKKQKVINVKEIRMTPNIEEHDLAVKAKNAARFLEDGDRVKVVVRFRGRELGKMELGREVLMQFAEMTSEYSVIDKQPTVEGKNMSMFLTPKK
ncbi:MAG TPA: translation initiation factor IF-3 [Sedimentibacter sp.]|jgi:translation initiation factor IF-3|nr:translation initiation factor IF-3 [Sedimentibacter sp.]HOK48830.1 translation initiation factor IF-3 [Sedimentibacter sp.]HOW22445.1 translation initiation factor IF-3 [Sedimentibacter sp.]HRC81748.1 translation initiation factor IF-3 [Sedimentibacter sp.]